MTLVVFNGLLDRVEDVVDLQQMTPRNPVVRYAERMKQEDPERYWNQ
jgi:hypothetical protein